MNLEERKLKLEIELEKTEQKEKDLKEKKKDLKARIEALNYEIEAEKNKKILAVIADTFGDVNDGNIEIFKQLLAKQREEKETDTEVMYGPKDSLEM